MNKFITLSTVKKVTVGKTTVVIDRIKKQNSKHIYYKLTNKNTGFLISRTAFAKLYQAESCALKYLLAE